MSAGKPGRALWVLSGLGVGAVLVSIALLLGIQRQLIVQQRVIERAALVRNAKQRCDLLKGILVERLQSLVASHPGTTSLRDIAGPVAAELDSFRMLEQTRQRVHVVIVDAGLHPVAALDPEPGAELSPCAGEILRGREAFHTLGAGGERDTDMPVRLCYACPVEQDGKLLGGLVIEKELDPVADVSGDLNRKMTWTVLATQLVLLGALTAIAWWAHRALSRTERRRAADERLVAVGNLAAGIAHEIRNPLNTISLTCRYVERVMGSADMEPRLRAEVNKNFEVVASELGRLTRTLDDFLLLAKPTDLNLGEADLDRTVDEALAVFQREFEAAHVQLLRQRAGSIRVLADADRLRQVFSNIIRNGIQAMRGGGTLSVATQCLNGQARVDFADTGPGVPAADFHRIFEPYYSTKRSGLGLGLSLSLKIIRAHGGALDVASRPGGGALFTVSLPAEPSSSEADHA